MKILVSAYACEPGKGSEPSVGWNHVRQIAKSHAVWVLTRSNNRSGIEQSLAKEPSPNAHWLYFDLPGWLRFWKKSRLGAHVYYYIWQTGAYFKAHRLHREVQFDLAHHVTFVNYWRPTFLALLPIPFVWGPVGGGESAPPSFQRAFNIRGRIDEALRDLARRLGELDPFVRLAARRAATALASTVQTEKRLRALGCRNVSVLSSVALPEEELRELMVLPLRQGAPFRVLSLGNLLQLKGFDLGIRAFARFHALFPDSEYWLIGDGPEYKRLKRLAGELGLKGSLIFWGTLPREQVFVRLGECDVLLFPTLHDSGGYASLEAMAAGLPVICLDLGGPGLQVNEATGIKVSAITPEQVVIDLAAALHQLAIDPLHRRRLGEASRARVQQEFSWEGKGERLAGIYEQVIKACKRAGQSGQRDRQPSTTSINGIAPPNPSGTDYPRT